MAPQTSCLCTTGAHVTQKHLHRDHLETGALLNVDDNEDGVNAGGACLLVCSSSRRWLVSADVAACSSLAASAKLWFTWSALLCDYHGILSGKIDPHVSRASVNELCDTLKWLLICHAN